MKWLSNFHLIYFSFFFITFFSYSATLPIGFTEKRIATGLDPTSLVVAPDGRVFVTVKSGKVVLIKEDIIQNRPFLTIRNVDSWNERGLLSLVLDPNFTNNHFLYVYYTYLDTLDGTSYNRVSRFLADGDSASLASEKVLINFNNLSAGYHNGGGLIFGKDGKLYASTGENTVSENAQDMGTLLGKVVRINSDGTIPTDNPFYTTAMGQNRAIYALGFRNPFKMKIQSGTNRIFVNNVGSSDWEEINELKPGRNYGWPMIEGKITTQTPPINYEDPLFVYNHDNGACAITGGAFYNSTDMQFPAPYQNRYFFSDYCGGWIRSIDLNNSYHVSDFASDIDRCLDMAIDGQGAMYYIARDGLSGGSDDANTSSSNGELWKISYTGSSNVMITVQPENKKVSIGSSATFIVSASGIPPLHYQWKRNGIDIPGEINQSYVLFQALASDSGAKFSVTVSNDSSSQTSMDATLSVIHNTPPVPEIISPVEGSLYKAGSTITFSGKGIDKEDGDLPASSFTWAIHFQHDTHYHPAMDPVTGISSGTYAIPDEGETSDTVWYRIILTVVDSLGGSATVYRDIYPEKAMITLQTVPSGGSIQLDGKTVLTPYTFVGVVGIKRAIAANAYELLDQSHYSFSSWSNGGSISQTISTPSTDATFNAFFSLAPLDTLWPLGDAYVRGGTNADVKFGVLDSTQLQTKLSNDSSACRQIYLSFDISKVKGIFSAELKMFGSKNSAENHNIAVEAYGLDEQKWQEITITWANKPAFVTSPLATTFVDALPGSERYYEWDVSDYLRNEKQKGDDTLSFLLSNREITASYVRFNSKEAGSNRPYLLLNFLTEPLDIQRVGEQEDEFILVPNPFVKEFQLKQTEPYEYSIYDLSGNRLITGKGSDFVILGNQLKAGNYLLKIQQRTQVKTVKIVKLQE